jgi:hypothetical protein
MDHSSKHRYEKSYHRQQESHEIVMIIDADTVIDPWAVMIKAFNALIANTAMTRPLSPYNLAVRA